MHKPNFSELFQFRPIFAAYSAPLYNLYKYLGNLISSFTTKDYTVDNSESFYDAFSIVPHADSYLMVSINVDTLFTNMPLFKTISTFLTISLPSSSTFLEMIRPIFEQILELSVINSFFLYNGALYKQVEGLGAGLPLGPVYIFMSFRENNWLSKCFSSLKPVFYKRYVND